MSCFGDFEHHFQVFVGDYIPNSWVMFNWDIYQPLYSARASSGFGVAQEAPRWEVWKTAFGRRSCRLVTWMIGTSMGFKDQHVINLESVVWYIHRHINVTQHAIVQISWLIWPWPTKFNKTWLCIQVKWVRNDAPLVSSWGPNHLFWGKPTLSKGQMFNWDIERAVDGWWFGILGFPD